MGVKEFEFYPESNLYVYGILKRKENGNFYLGLYDSEVFSVDNLDECDLKQFKYDEELINNSLVVGNTFENEVKENIGIMSSLEKGDKVWSCEYGFGIVKNIDKEKRFGILVEFENDFGKVFEEFNFNGKIKGANNRTLFFDWEAKEILKTLKSLN